MVKGKINIWYKQVRGMEGQYWAKVNGRPCPNASSGNHTRTFTRYPQAIVAFKCEECGEVISQVENPVISGSGIMKV